MRRSTDLSISDEGKFEKLVMEMKDTIYMAIRKCNIRERDIEEFYSYALEGLLVSFRIMEQGDISEEDFPRYAFVAMKRKVIDEIRRRSRKKDIPTEHIEEVLFVEQGNPMISVEFYSSLESALTKEEKEFFDMYCKFQDIKKTVKKLKISQWKGYEHLKSIRKKCERLIFDKNV